jgi:4-oxalocrotonate tautomerase
MPVVQIHMIEGRTIEQKRALVKKVADAVHETIGAPLENIHVILSDMPRTNYADAGILHADK